MAGPGEHGADKGRDEPVTSVSRTDGAIVVALAGELDLYNAQAIREALVAACGEEPERVVVDLSAVTFVDSTVLGVLVEARTLLTNRRAFLLAAPAVETRRALEISGLDRHFAVHDSVAAALDAPLE